MENLEILKNIKDYMQWCIDRGYHKFTYNDLGWDFKCIDAINLIDDVLNHITKQEKMIDIIIKHICDIIDNDDNASLLPFYNSDDNIEEKVRQYFEKKVEESE